MEINVSQNLKSGFRKAGIHPLDRSQALARLPDPNDEQAVMNAAAIDDSIIDILNELEHGCSDASTPQTRKRTRVAVSPGKSVSVADLRTNLEPEASSSGATKARKQNSNIDVMEDSGSSSEESDDLGEKPEKVI